MNVLCFGFEIHLFVLRIGICCPILDVTIKTFRVYTEFLRLLTKLIKEKAALPIAASPRNVKT